MVHNLGLSHRWETCGVIVKEFRCRCGFYTEAAPGGGCWQQGHDKGVIPSFDSLHEVFQVHLPTECSPLLECK